jgi:4-oxalocrotonate tautomerase/trans-3-chloroacrylic acid dehalogenase beta subunit
MPFVQCHISVGLSVEQKKELIREVVKVTSDAIGSDPKIINVIINEHQDVNMSISGRIYGESHA